MIAVMTATALALTCNHSVYAMAILLVEEACVDGCNSTDHECSFTYWTASSADMMRIEKSRSSSIL